MSGKHLSRNIFLVADSVNELGGISSWLQITAVLFSEHGHKVSVIGISVPQTPQILPRNHPYLTVTLYETFPLRGGRQHGVDKLSALFSAAIGNGVVIVAQAWAMEWVRLADTAGMPVVAMSHESYEYSRQCSRLSRIRECYEKADRMVVLTHEDADLWLRDGMDRVDYIPNPLPFYPDVSSSLTASNVITVGRLHAQKGIDMLLEAWAILTNRWHGWRLKIYGSGPEEASLKALCSKLGLDHTVDWMGTTNDVSRALSRASIFVQSSRGEGFPFALLESMASGVPCIAFECAPGVREIIRSGVDGILVQTGDIESLADSVGLLMGDSHMRSRMGKRARDNIRRFSGSVYMRRWEKLFTVLDQQHVRAAR